MERNRGDGVRPDLVPSEPDAERVATVLLVSRLRWAAGALSATMALLTEPPPLSRLALLALSLLMLAYNIGAAMARRLSVRPLEALVFGSLVGDFAVCAAWVLLTGNDPATANYVVFMVVSVEAAVLFRWKGAIGSIAIALGTFGALLWERTVLGVPNMLASYLFRVSIVVIMACLSAGLAQESHRRRRAAETALRAAEEAAAEATRQSAHSVALARELEHANQTKSTFLATMSHELRTPLNAILGFTDLVRDGVTGPISATTRDHLERVSRNGHILLDLINDVLDLSKIEAGRMPVSLRTIDVEQEVRQVVSNLQPLAEQKGLPVEVIVPPGGCTALADARALTQIVTNLLSNAIAYADHGTVRVELRSSSKEVAVVVSDDGPGISAADQAVIFEPFRRVGATAHTGTGGTGLGLAISARLAQLLGGELTLVSTRGIGSHFTLHLPRAARAAPAPAILSGRPVVLAVDDDEDSLRLWRSHCERMGFIFVGLQQPDDAVPAAIRIAPAVILLDVRFPQASGWDLLTALRREPRTASIPVHIVSTADDEQVAVERGVRFVHKPVTEAQFRAALAPYVREDQEVVA